MYLCVFRLVESCAAQCRVEGGRTRLLRQWLELELATAGNVTCLVGTPGDPWYPPCVELVEQRAAGEGLKVGGAGEGLKVGGTRVGLKVGGAREGLKVGGARVGLKVGGAGEGLKVGGAREGLKVGGAGVGLKVGGTREGLKVGGTREGPGWGWGVAEGGWGHGGVRVHETVFIVSLLTIPCALCRVPVWWVCAVWRTGVHSCVLRRQCARSSRGRGRGRGRWAIWTMNF